MLDLCHTPSERRNSIRVLLLILCGWTQWEEGSSKGLARMPGLQGWEGDGGYIWVLRGRMLSVGLSVFYRPEIPQNFRPPLCADLCAHQTSSETRLYSLPEINADLKQVWSCKKKNKLKREKPRAQYTLKKILLYITLQLVTDGPHSPVGVWVFFYLCARRLQLMTHLSPIFSPSVIDGRAKESSLIILHSLQRNSMLILWLY